MTLAARSRLLLALPAAALAAAGSFAVMQTVPFAAEQAAQDDAQARVLQNIAAEQQKVGDLRAGAVRLSECDEALEFFDQEGVREFVRANFGYSLDPDSTFYGECPTKEELQARYDQVVEAAESGGGQ